MTYLSLNNMKEYTEEKLKNKCNSPWLVCAFAIVFVILTSLLIYVAWSPRTTVENIKINVEEVPLPDDLLQEIEDSNLQSQESSYENLSKFQKHSPTLGSQKKNLTTPKSEEKIHILDVDSTTTEETPSEELLIWIIEEPEPSPDYKDEIWPVEKKIESPWSIIKKSWYMETNIQNLGDNGVQSDTDCEDKPKILPGLGDIMTADQFFPLIDLMNGRTTLGGRDDEPSPENDTEGEIVIILPAEEDPFDQIDLETNDSLKKMMDALKGILGGDPFNQVSNGTEGDDVPDDMRDLMTNMRNIADASLDSFLKNIFAANDTDLEVKVEPQEGDKNDEDVFKDVPRQLIGTSIPPEPSPTSQTPKEALQPGLDFKHFHESKKHDFDPSGKGINMITDPDPSFNTYKSNKVGATSEKNDLDDDDAFIVLGKSGEGKGVPDKLVDPKKDDFYDDFIRKLKKGKDSAQKIPVTDESYEGDDDN